MRRGWGFLALMRPDSLTNTSLGSLAVQSSVAKTEDDLHKNIIFGEVSGWSACLKKKRFNLGFGKIKNLFANSKC